MIEISIGILIVLVIVIGLYNMLISSRNKVHNAKSSIDVYLKKRFDLIPNLIETVKGYKEYEKEVLTELTKIRTLYTEGQDLSKDCALDSKYKKMLILSENYPDLKASDSFVKLQEELESLEDELQAARRYYNSCVTKYNTQIQMIPLNIIATIFVLKEENLYEVSEDEKQKIEVKI